MRYEILQLYRKAVQQPVYNLLRGFSPVFIFKTSFIYQEHPEQPEQSSLLDNVYDEDKGIDTYKIAAFSSPIGSIPLAFSHVLVVPATCG